MAGGVDVKMGVSGIAQFKQNIAAANNSLKTLDAQMQLTEKQFQATGDKEAYLQQKTELLKVKLEEQKSVADQAEKALAQMAANGVDKASKAYQDMQRQMLNAKSGMLDTESQLQNVTVAADDSANGVSEMNAQLKRVGDGVSWENVSNGLHTINQGISSAITHAWKLGEALVQATLGAGAWADELKTTAAQYSDLGIDEEDLQRMRKTASQIDTDVETILESRSKLQKNMEEGNKNAMGALSYLGIDPSGKNNLDLFWEAGEAIAKLGEEEDKVHYAQALFGKSWRELLPLFQAGREEYDELSDSWSVVEKDQLDGLDKMDDQYNKMQSEWETFKIEMLSAFSGPLTEGMETITGLFQELNAYLDTPEGKEMLAQIGDTISGLISDLTNINPEDVINNLKAIIDGIVNSLRWIDEHQQDVKTALEVIGLAFAGLKVAEVASNIGKIVSGFQTLWSGKNNPIPSLPNVPGTPGTPTAPGTGTGTGGGTSIGWTWGDTRDALLGLGGLALIKKGFEAAADQRLNHAEEVRGTDENLTAKSAGVESLLVDYIRAEKAMNDPELIMASEEEFLATQQLLEQTRQKLLGTEGGAEALGAYNDWRQENSYGNMYWEVPEALERMTEVADDLNNSGAKKIDDAGGKIEGAAKDMSKLPKDTADAVKSALNGTRVVIDGAEMAAVVGQIMAGMYAQFTV